MSRREHTLYRDTDDQKIGGVCSGLARYFDLDPLLVRVAFVAATVFSGVSLVVYALLWWLVDPAPSGHWSEDDHPVRSPVSPPDSTSDSPSGGDRTPPRRDDWVA